MLNLFQQSIYDIDPPSFGLDLSDFSLKIALFDKEAKYWKLASFKSSVIPEGIVTNGEIIDEGKAVRIIKDSLQKVRGKKITSRYVVASLPEEKAFLRVIQLPKMKQEEVKEAVKYEAENNIPMSIDEVYLDWQVIAPAEGHIDHFDVLIIAVPRAVVDQYAQLFEKAGLIPRVFEVESVAIARSVIENTMSEKPALIIDLGQARTSFIVFSGRTLRFTSSLGISGGSFTNAIERELKIDSTRAEELKLKHGLLKKGKEGVHVFESLVPALTDLVEQIKNYLDFYQSHSKHEHLTKTGTALPISKIVLCGGGASLKGLDSFFTLNLKLPVEKANPWVNILRPPLKEIPDLSYDTSLGYTTALGLALRGAKKF